MHPTVDSDFTMCFHSRHVYHWATFVGHLMPTLPTLLQHRQRCKREGRARQNYSISIEERSVLGLFPKRVHQNPTNAQEPITTFQLSLASPCDNFVHVHRVAHHHRPIQRAIQIGSKVLLMLCHRPYFLVFPCPYTAFVGERT